MSEVPVVDEASASSPAALVEKGTKLVARAIETARTNARGVFMVSGVPSFQR
jgi:hypothetical protein